MTLSSSRKVILRRKLGEAIAQRTGTPYRAIPNEGNVDFDEFVGLHMLSGFEYVSQYREARDAYHDSPAALLFVLDGVTYAAVENPDDGYRSSMGYIETCGEREAAMCRTRFDPVEIEIKLDNYQGGNDEPNDCMEFIDTTTGLRVLWVGTTRGDSYYPSFVSEVSPENLKWNSDVRRPEVVIPKLMTKRRFRT